MTPAQRRAKQAANATRSSQGAESRRERRKRIDQIRADIEYGVPLRYADLERVIEWEVGR